MKNKGLFGVLAVVGLGLGAEVVHAQEVQKEVREIHLNPRMTPETDPLTEVSKIRITAEPFTSTEAQPGELNKIHRGFLEETSCGLIHEQNEDPLSIAGIALKVWDIVQDNRAVLNVETQNVKALPNIAKDRWEALTGWKPEHGIRYTLELENLIGMTVVTLKYDVSLIYGGNVRGVGKYIASARVVPRNIDVLWGFNLDVRVRETAVLNLGTEKNPFAAIKLDVTLSYGSILRKMAETVWYRLDADGAIHDLTNAKSYFRK